MIQQDCHSHCSGVYGMTLSKQHTLFLYVIVSLFLSLNVFNLPEATKKLNKIYTLIYTF